MPRPRIAAVAASTLLLSLATVLTALPAQAAAIAVPRLPHAVSLTTIEADPPYVPQVSCDAVAKPGVIRFRNLVLPTYARYGAQDWGMAVSCAAEGMTSEHADGRAWDFALNSHNKTQHAAAERFLTWLFAPDAAGNDQANARRFGIMYVIYSDRIREVGGDWQPYLPAQCGASVKKRNVTVCHENHIHLSFTWNGAEARTSAWTGTVFPTDYGPCVPIGKKVAPKWKRPNLTPCPGARTGNGGGGNGRPPRPWPVTVPLPTPGPVAVTLPVPPAPTPTTGPSCPGDGVETEADDGTWSCSDPTPTDPGDDLAPSGG